MRLRSQSGSVTLVALCCVAVLSIVLTGYLAVSNNAMQLSNRAYAKDVSRHLAEMGLERALRSISYNTFGGWTPDANPVTTTRRSFTITSAHYGSSGITGTVNLRFDHYNAKVWDAVTAFTTTSMVWYGGIWFQCINGNTNHVPPSASYWVSAPQVWEADTTYNVNDISLVGANRYVCTTANSNHPPPNLTYWSAASAVAPWSAATAYVVDNVALSGGTAYRCIASNTNQAPPNATYWVCAPVVYSEGVATLNNNAASAIKTQLRATVVPVSLFPNALTATTDVMLSAGGTIDSYNSSLGTYNQTTSPFSVASPNIGSSAVVSGGDTASTAVSLTTTRVNGYVAVPSSTTAPYNPRLTNSATAILTSVAAPTIPSPRMDLTRVSRSPYQPQNDIISVTATNFLSVSSGTTNLPGGSDTISADGKYYYYTSGTLYLDTGYTLNITGPVVIDIRPTSTADLQIQGSGQIIINNTATASLEIHFGDELYIGSNTNAGIVNQTLDPKRCILIGTSTYNFSAYHYFWSNQPFYGVIYMPNAYVHMWNSGYSEQFYGAISAKNIYFNHVANLHFDTSLRTATFGGIDNPYIVRQWRELTDKTEQVALP